MSLEKKCDLVMALAERTKNGQLDWKPTEDESQFQVSITENTVRIHMDTSGSTADMYIYLLNKEGVTIDSFSDVDLNESGIQPPGGRAGWFAFMRELYESARRSAYGANKILDELLKSLKKD